jgi:hypothetical protein
MGVAGRVFTIAMKARSESRSSLAWGSSTFKDKSTPLPPPLARETQRVTGADWNAFWAAVKAYSRARVGPQAIGEAAQKAMRDIQAIRATCARKPR